MALSQDIPVQLDPNPLPQIHPLCADSATTFGKVSKTSPYCCIARHRSYNQTNHRNIHNLIPKGIVTGFAKVSRLAVMFALLLSCVSCATKLHASTDEPILGKTELSFEQITEFIQSNNPNFDPEIARHYVAIGKQYGIRAEIAISQAILETGWFEFKHSKAVKSDHHNYCGLGVTSSTTQGCCFDRIDDGVKAHIQHLFAYATDKPLPKGETLVDPRFKYVKRACAPSLSGLTGTWAMSNQYSKRIMDIYNRMQAFVKNKGSQTK